MIKFGDWTIPGVCEWYFAVEGMRNPFNSWDMSDSNVKGKKNGYFDLGENDKGLAIRLTVAGPEHRKFLRMLNAYVRITAPLYFLKELDTYKIGTVCNSCSTMHKIMDHEFTLDDFSHDKLSVISLESLKDIIKQLNTLRNLYLNSTDNAMKKQYWYEIIQLLPSSYMQTRNYMFSFETLMNIHKQRRGHKLDEWHKFCEEIEKIPYLNEFIEAVEDE
jgi:hypothetical protein